MKRFAVIALLILIALLFLWAAKLDGLIHIEAFAAGKCEFCEYLETHDLEAERTQFATNIQGNPGVVLSYELVLYCRAETKGHQGVHRAVLLYNVKPLRYCPLCGKKLSLGN